MAINIPGVVGDTQIKTPDTINTLGSMMNVARQGQAYQANDMDLQKAQQANQERQNLQQFTQNPDNWQTNGHIDQDKLNAAVPKIAPLTGGDYLQHMTTLGNAQTTASNASLAFTGNQRSIVANLSGILGRGGIDDPKTVSNEFDRLKMQYPDPNLSKYIDAAKVSLGSLPAGKGVVNNALMTLSQSMLTAPEQQQAFTPTAGTLQTGNDTLPIKNTPSILNRDPSVEVSGPAIAGAQIPPGQMQTPGNDANGNPITINRDKYGKTTTANAMPTGPGVVFPGYDNITELQKIRSDANAAAKQAPDIQQFANNVIKYSKDANTSAFKLISNKFGSIVPTTGNMATDNQLMGHELARLQGSVTTSAGLNGSNAARDLGKAMTADGDNWSGEAIQSSSRALRAVGQTGAQLYNMGIEKAVAAQGPAGARAFQNKWSATANLDALRLYDAMKNQDADPDGGEQVVKALGGVKSTRYQKAVFDVDKMRSLIQGGN